MPKNELIRSLGLNDYEGRVYAALVGAGRVRVQQLADLLPVPRPQVYLALKKLVAKGMCTEHKGNVTRYSAVPPAVAFQDMLCRDREVLRAREQAVKELDKIHNQSKKEEQSLEFVEVLRGRNVTARTVMMYRQARREILECSRLNLAQGRANTGRVFRRELAALKRGIKVRSIYEEDVLKDRVLLSCVRKAQQAGEEGRVLSSVPMNMIISDETVAAFSLSTLGEDIVVYQFNHPALVAMVREGFENMWARGRKFPPLAGRGKQSTGAGD